MYFLFKIKTLIRYQIKARTIHLIHSPFVFSMMNAVFSKKTHSLKWKDIETLYRQQKKCYELIEMVDFGAKGNADGSIKKTYTISKLAKLSAISKHQGRILTNMVSYFQPKTILELGTSLGFGTAYLACEQKNGETISIEGSPNIAEQAKKNFKSLSINNIKQFVGNFDVVLVDVLKEIDQLDFVYIDGNHTFEATMRYFEQCLPLVHNDTIIVLDDIHWSPGMTQAWEKIKKHPLVTVSLDFYRMGCVFFRKESSKEDFILQHRFF